MLTYKKIIQSGVMTESIATLLFTENVEVHKQLLSANAWVEQIYRVCVFYRALIQAYVIGEAIANDRTINELGYSGRLCHAVRCCWPEKDKNVPKNEKELFSFLNDCDCFLGPDGVSIILDFAEQYRDYSSASIRGTYSIDDEDYLEYLRTFPLLASTEVDFKNMKFLFSSDREDPHRKQFSISCSPFIYFSQKREYGEGVVEHLASSGLALVSVRQGEKNGELLFDLTDFHPGKDGGGYRFRTIRRQAPKDERLYQICKALGMNTEWYQIDEYLCNMAFLVRITDASKAVLNNFWRKSQYNELNTPSSNIAPKLALMLQGNADMQHSVERHKDIMKDDIDRILYGLYIDFGVFRTMRELLKDSRKHTYGKELFDEYMDYFVQMGQRGQGGISARQREIYERECEENIALRLKKLSGIVSEGLPRYNKRMRAIVAEWRAFYILKAAGIHSNNLFPDEESILSIDDYFSMIKNPSTILQSGLNSVLTLLIELYGALMASEGEFDEVCFREAVLQIRQKISNCDTVELFDALKELVRYSENNDTTVRLIGRRSICDAEKLEEMANHITRHFKQEKQENSSLSSQILTKKGIFISYAHADKALVLDYVHDLQKAGIRVFLDDEQFVIGDDWTERAQQEIVSPDCMGVLVFLSRSSGCSKAVMYEIEEAKRNKKVLLPVNLEEVLVEQYLEDLVHDAPVAKRKYASKIRDCIPESIIAGKDRGQIRECVTKLVQSDDEDNLIEQHNYNQIELAIANFYAFLKFSDGNIGDNEKFDWTSADDIDRIFHQDTYEVSRCIYPLVTSVKETKIKRDNIALMGYEILRDKGEDKRGTNYIFSSSHLSPDDYYCIPNYRTTGEDGVWMVNPVMISHRLLRPKDEEDT